MDIDTLIILSLTFCAFCWWFGLRIAEDRKIVRECNQQEKERLERQERVKSLYNRQ